MSFVVFLSTFAESARAQGGDPEDAIELVSSYTDSLIQSGVPAEEAVPVVAQPSPLYNPVFIRYFDAPANAACPKQWFQQPQPTASELQKPNRRVYAAVGGGRLFVSSPDNECVLIYDVDDLSYVGQYKAPGKRLGGLTFYRDEVFVVDMGNGAIDVLTPDGVFKRTLPALALLSQWNHGLTKPLVGRNLVGIDAAWGELWVSIEGGGVIVLDAVSGMPRRVHGRRPDTAWHEDPSWLIPTAERPAPIRAETIVDLAIAPEVDAVFTGKRFMMRQPFEIGAGLFPETNEAVLDEQVKLNGRTQGIDQVWGMRWFLAAVTDADIGDHIYEASIETETNDQMFSFVPPEYRPPGDYRYSLSYRRIWPVQDCRDRDSNPGCYEIFRDVVYHDRETRFDWTGNLTKSDWINGDQDLTYAVSDGDIFVVGRRGEHHYDLAREFGHVELEVDGVRHPFSVNGSAPALTSTAPGGILTFDTERVPSGVHELKLTAYLANGTKVEAVNDDLHIDHDPPTGTVGNPDYGVSGPLTITGSLADAHKGPRDWVLQEMPNGDVNWSDACAVDAPGPYECTLDTSTYSEGRLRLRAQLRDAVADRYANLQHSEEVITFVDRSPPTIAELSGDLYERRNGQVIYDSEDPSVTVRAEDSSTGVASIELQVDGQTIHRATQSCVAGGCHLIATFRLEADRYREGTHEVRVSAVDYLGHQTEASWNIQIEATPEELEEESAFNRTGRDIDDSEEWESVDSPETEYEGPIAEDEEYLDSEVSPGSSSRMTTRCAPDDEWTVGAMPEYGLIPAVPPLAPTPALALARLLLQGGAIPPVPPIVFSVGEESLEHIVYISQIDGDVRAMVVVESFGAGWIGTYYEGCSQFPEEIPPLGG